MTEHNDIPAITPAEPLKAHRAGKLFRLGVSCLVLLMFTALLLVGGSFSKNTSGGTIEVSTDLTAAEFNVHVDEDDPFESGESYDGDDYHTVGYSFTIYNDSEVDVTYDIEFEDIKIDFGENSDFLTNLIVFLDEDGEIINFDGSGEYGDILNGINYTEEMVYLKAGEQKSYVLVLNSEECRGNKTIYGEITGTITITVNQAEGGS